MSAAQIAQVQFATQASGQYLATALAANGRSCWDCFRGENLLPPPYADTVRSEGGGRGFAPTQ